MGNEKEEKLAIEKQKKAKAEIEKREKEEKKRKQHEEDEIETHNKKLNEDIEKPQENSENPIEKLESSIEMLENSMDMLKTNDERAYDNTYCQEMSPTENGDTDAGVFMEVEDVNDSTLINNEKHETFVAHTESMIEEAQVPENNIEHQVVQDGQDLHEDQFESFFHHQPLEDPQVIEQEISDELMWQPVEEEHDFQENIQVNQQPQVKKEKRKKTNNEPNFQMPKVEMPKMEIPKMEMP